MACMTDQPQDPRGLPPLDPDAGLFQQAWNAGDHIIVEVMTVGEALDQHASLAERGSAPGVAHWPDHPDEMHVADDGRPIQVHYTPAARHRRDS